MTSVSSTGTSRLASISKLFEEERELTVLLLVDVSASSLFGTVHARKKDLITELCAVLAFSAVNNGDKVGVIFFSDRVEGYIPPKKGRDHVLFIVRRLLTIEPKSKGTNLSEAIRFFNHTARQKAIVFLLSDFLEENDRSAENPPVANFEDALKVAGKKHDLIGIKVYDQMDMQLPAIGMIEAEDSETGGRYWVDTNDYLVRSNYQQYFFNQTEYCKSIFQKAGCDLLHLRTDEDYVKILQRFFVGRHRPG
jgi:uncharacterized protein (DUF58 family)